MKAADFEKVEQLLGELKSNLAQQRHLTTNEVSRMSIFSNEDHLMTLRNPAAIEAALNGAIETLISEAELTKQKLKNLGVEI